MEGFPFQGPSDIVHFTNEDTEAREREETLTHISGEKNNLILFISGRRLFSPLTLRTRLCWGRRREGERCEGGGDEQLYKTCVVTQRLLRTCMPGTPVGVEVDIADARGERGPVTAHLR